MKVVVIGGGVAGVSAAVGASRSGASVTLLEGSSALGPNRAVFPYILSGECPAALSPGTDASRLSAEFGVDVRLGERVLGVDPLARTARTSEARLDFDSLVVATGSRQLATELRGASKRDVFVLRSLEDYAALSRSSDSLSYVAVTGPAPLCLLVAQMLSKSCRVSAFIGHLALRRFSPGVEAMVSQAAVLSGVELLNAEVDSIVGTGRVEAVISAGKVHPCDAVVVLPRSVPFLPEVTCSTGSHGGLLVDRRMRTSSTGVFAAGDCAELRLGATSVPARLHSSSSVMGEVAGLNAAGASVQANVSGSLAVRLFGVEVCSAGIDLDEAARAGLDAGRVDSDCSPAGGQSCPLNVSIVYDRATRRVHGIQLAGPAALSLSEFASFAVASGATLEGLAYLESPYLPGFSGERSPIALTAGKGLALLEAPSLEAPGTDLRHG